MTYVIYPSLCPCVSLVVNTILSSPFCALYWSGIVGSSLAEGAGPKKCSEKTQSQYKTNHTEALIKITLCKAVASCLILIATGASTSLFGQVTSFTGGGRRDTNPSSWRHH